MKKIATFLFIGGCAAASLGALPSLVPGVMAAGSEIVASIVRSRPLVENRRTPVVISLKHQSGFPVMLEELEVVHTEPIHLLIVDPALRDYHHHHPRPMPGPGEYVFTMTPRTPCGYRIWADLDTRHGSQQYAVTDIPGRADCSKQAIDRTPRAEFTDSNYRFNLDLGPQALVAGKDATIKVTVRELGGRFVQELQPVMGTFAHMVGFYDDYRTIAHIHPQGPEPEDMYDEGGPTLAFHLQPARAGFLKLFVQFRIGGRDVFASFGVIVAEDGFSGDMFDFGGGMDLHGDAHDDGTVLGGSGGDSGVAVDAGLKEMIEDGQKMLERPIPSTEDAMPPQPAIENAGDEDVPATDTRPPQLEVVEPF